VSRGSFAQRAHVPTALRPAFHALISYNPQRFPPRHHPKAFPRTIIISTMASPRTQRSKKRRPSSLQLALPPPAPAHPSFPRRHTSLVNTLESETDSDVDLSLPTFNFPLRRGSEPTAQLIRRPLFHSLARRPLRRALLIGVATQASSPPEWDLSETNWGLTQDGNFLAAQETREAGSLRAHEDVEAMRTMLIGAYIHPIKYWSPLIDHLTEVFKYRDEGITIMLDREGIAPHLVPTEQNIVSCSLFLESLPSRIMTAISYRSARCASW
jgi:hypothetical protein